MKRGEAVKIARYIVAGGLTTAVSFGSLWLFKDVLHIELNISNTLSVIAAVLFAYVINKLFVFRSKTSGLKALAAEAAAFFSARAATMLIEVGGMFLVHTVFGLAEEYSYYSKAVISVAVLVLNYVFSKLLVFKSK